MQRRGRSVGFRNRWLHGESDSAAHPQRPGAQISACPASPRARAGPIAGWYGPGWPFRAGAVECGGVRCSMPRCRGHRWPIGLKSGCSGVAIRGRPDSADSREPRPEGRDGVGEREPPVAHRLARWAAASARGRPTGAACWLAARSTPGPPRSRRRCRSRAGPRGPSRRGTRGHRSRGDGSSAARLVDQGVLPDELDDRVGDVRACRSACRSRRRRPAATRPPPSPAAPPRAILAGKSLPGGPWSHAVRTIASGANGSSRRPLSRQRARPRACSPRRR